MKEISLAFRDIAEGVKRLEKMDFNTLRRAMTKASLLLKECGEREKKNFQLSLDILLKNQNPQQKV